MCLSSTFYAVADLDTGQLLGLEGRTADITLAVRYSDFAEAVRRAKEIGGVVIRVKREDE